jgi:hypothetical protein
MNTTPADETILKTDVLGRVKTPKERREQVLDEFERSGLSGKKFAALVGIKYPTLATWWAETFDQTSVFKSKLTARRKHIVQIQI